MPLECFILDNIPDAFYTLDHQWRFTYINHSAEKMWSRRREELIGNVIWEEFPQAIDSNAYHEHLRAAREGHPITFETLSPILNYWIACTICPNENGLSVYFHDITEQKKSERRGKLLQDVIAALSEALTVEAAAQVIVGNVRASLGGHIGMVSLVTKDGKSLKIVRTTDLAQEIYDQLEYAPLDAARPDAETIRTGRAVWIQNPEEYYACYPQLAEAVQKRTGTQALAFLPLVVSGNIIGSLYIGFPEPRLFSEEERSFLTTIAHYCAQAMERAQLFEAEQRSRIEAENQTDRLKQLHVVAARISHALTQEDVVNAVINDGLMLLGATRGSVAVLSEDGQNLHAFGLYRYTPEIVEKFSHIPMTASTPMTDAVRTQQPVIIRSAEEYRERYPELVKQLAAVDISQTLLALPLIIQEKVIGGMGISYIYPQDITPIDLEFMQILAQHCAEGLERIRLYQLEAEARVAHELAATNARLQKEVEARKTLEEELRANLEHEKELNDLKTRFISTVSHEFRTPMAVIMSSSDLLRQYGNRMDEEQRNKHWDRIKAHIKQLTRLVENVLSLGRTQTVGLEFHSSPVDLKELCDEVVADMQAIDERHEIVFTSNGLCGTVTTDKPLMKLLAANLLSNAMKYSPNADKVFLHLTCEDGGVVIRVQDHGIGVPKTDLPYLFEPYFRAANVSSISGTGIGLTLVQEIVDLHGGSVDVDSKVGKGTTVTVWLPV